MESIEYSMMEVSMEEEDTDMYSSPYENYYRLLTTIKEIESASRLTEDWFEEHKQHILKYREVFPNFRKVNEEMQDSDFRTKAEETETILSNLIHEIQTRNIFTSKVYLLLNKRLKHLCELIWGEDELLEMMRKMGL
jgi:hypothetical protein